jgi:transposase
MTIARLSASRAGRHRTRGSLKQDNVRLSKEGLCCACPDQPMEIILMLTGLLVITAVIAL